MAWIDRCIYEISDRLSVLGEAIRPAVYQGGRVRINGWTALVAIMIGMFVLSLLAGALAAVFSLIGTIVTSVPVLVGLAGGIAISAVVQRKLVARTYELEQDNRRLRASVEQLQATVDQFIAQS